MTKAWRSSEFINLLNSNLTLELFNDKEHFFLKSERPEARVGWPGHIIFAREIDLVIQGPCADTRKWKPTNDFPMGRCLPCPEENVSRSWLHAKLAHHYIKNVLLFAECCGSYPFRYRRMLRRLFPEVNWLMPEMHDLYQDFLLNPLRSLTVARCLLEAGLIRGEKSP